MRRRKLTFSPFLAGTLASLFLLAACSGLAQWPPGPTPIPYASVADLLQQRPPNDTLVQIDAYYSKYIPGTYIPVVRPDEYGCPRWAAVLADQPVPHCEPFNDDYICTSPPAAMPVVDVMMPGQIVKGKEVLPPSLPYHARFVGHLGDSRLAHCWDADRIFVVVRVDSVFEEKFPTPTATAALPPPTLPAGAVASPLSTPLPAAVAVSPLNTPAPSATPWQPITVSLTIGQPIMVGHRLPITVTAHARQALQDVGLGLILFQNRRPIHPDWPPRHLKEIGAGETIQLTDTVVFPSYGSYQMRVEVHPSALSFIATDTLLIDIPEHGEPLVVTATPWPTATGSPPPLTPMLAPAMPPGTWTPPGPTRTPGGPLVTP